MLVGRRPATQRIFTALACALAMGVIALAQPSVTISLRSGETLSAELVDLGGVGFTVRTGGRERRIATGDVAVIDFGGGAAAEPAEAANLGGRHLLMLRDGGVVRGELIDIGGVQPLRLTFRSDAGERDYSSNEVRRIYLSRPAEAAPSAAATPVPLPGPASSGYRADANQRWSTTNISVRRGQRVQFTGSGEVELAAGGAVRCGPAGSGNRDAGAPMPGVPTGTLIGRVDPGRLRVVANPFVIGAGATVAMPNDGVLTLGVNDGELSDNRGAFDVRITVLDQRRR